MLLAISCAEDGPALPGALCELLTLEFLPRLLLYSSNLSMAQMPTGQKQARTPQSLLYGAQGASRCFPLPSGPKGPEWHLPPVLGISWHQVHPVAGDSSQDALRETRLQLGPLQGRHPVLLPHHRHNVEADLPPATGHQQGQVQLPFLQASSIQ